MPLPTGPKHVHSYLLRGDDGWTLVDTGLGLMETPWEEILAQLDGPVVRIFITHMHPDHVGGAEAAAAATGAPVLQGRLDYAQCERVWGANDWPERIAEWFLLNGVPPQIAEELIEPGDEVDGWRVLATPGHADGHLCLYRDGVLIAGDHILDPITPAIGLYPQSRPDPLGDYIDSLHRVAELAPRISYGGHGGTVADPPGRAQEIVAHHERRLDKTEAALADGPRSGYEVSHALFGSELAPIQRRFAVAEALSHLERLVVLGRASRTENDRGVTYTGG